MGGKEEGEAGGKEDGRLQLRCQSWRNCSGKEGAAYTVSVQDVAAKCSRRDFN